MNQTTSLWLYTYWNGLRDGRKAPQRFEIEPSKISPVLPETFILECDEDDEFRLRLAGTRICEFFGRELRGARLPYLIGDNDDRVAVQSLLHTIKTDYSAGVVILNALTAKGRKTPLEMLLLPLTHTSDQVNRMMGCLTALKEPYWLGADPIKNLEVTQVDLIWPDMTPHFTNESAPKTVPPVPLESSKVHVVITQGRKFRVIEGGKPSK